MHSSHAIHHERAPVSRRFSTIFGCQQSNVHRASGGYVAEGCGVVAHFACFESDASREALGRFHARFSEERERGALTLASGDERE